MDTSLVTADMIPAEVVGDMSKMFEAGKSYEVIVSDKMNPSAKEFAFGHNGHLGEYPTNARIRLKGEEIQHLFNCVYEVPITEVSGDGFPRVTGKRMVCRFSITPTSWGALPENAVLIQPHGVQSARVDAEKAAHSREEKAAQEHMHNVAVDEMMADRQKELETLSAEQLKELAAERGIDVKDGSSTACVVDAILKFEEKMLRGED